MVLCRPFARSTSSISRILKKLALATVCDSDPRHQASPTRVRRTTSVTVVVTVAVTTPHPVAFVVLRPSPSSSPSLSSCSQTHSSRPIAVADRLTSDGRVGEFGAPLQSALQSPSSCLQASPLPSPIPPKSVTGSVSVVRLHLHATPTRYSHQSQLTAHVFSVPSTALIFVSVIDPSLSLTWCHYPRPCHSHYSPSPSASSIEKVCAPYSPVWRSQFAFLCCRRRTTSDDGTRLTS